MSSPHISIATAIEKNKIASNVAFVVLLAIAVTDASNNLIETLYLAKNSEPLVYQGNEYIASNFQVKLDLTTGQTPRLTVDAQDPTGMIRDRMEVYNGGVGFEVTMTVVNTGNIDQPPEIEEVFEIISSSASEWTVSFSMGVDNPLAQRFPYRLQWRDQCPYIYKGPRCKYAGSNASCDFTYFGANGCKAHGNQANFGGFLGLANAQSSTFIPGG